jgi:hypothetical protein
MNEFRDCYRQDLQGLEVPERPGQVPREVVVVQVHADQVLQAAELLRDRAPEIVTVHFPGHHATKHGSCQYAASYYTNMDQEFRIWKELVHVPELLQFPQRRRQRTRQSHVCEISVQQAGKSDQHIALKLKNKSKLES